VKLTAKEYALLRLLVQHRGRVVTHRQILRDLWGPNAEENTHYLRVYMTHLRQKLEPAPHTPVHLKTDAGIGYRLVME
jgi:two-component system KDP operon response regulator KdpE